MTVIYPSLHGAVTITTGLNDVVRLDEAGTIANATIAQGVYYLRGDGSGNDLLAAIATALSAAFAGGNTYGVVVTDGSGNPTWNLDPTQTAVKVRITRTAGAINFRVKWDDGSATFLKSILGFVNTKAAADGNDETSTVTPNCVWVPTDVYRERVRTKQWEVAETETADGDKAVVQRSNKNRIDALSFQLIDKARIFIEDNAADPTGALESFIDNNIDGRALELHERGLFSGTVLLGVSSSTIIGGVSGAGGFRLGEAASVLKPTLVNPGLPLYNFDLPLIGATT